MRLECYCDKYNIIYTTVLFAPNTRLTTFSCSNNIIISIHYYDYNNMYASLISTQYKKIIITIIIKIVKFN